MFLQQKVLLIEEEEKGSKSECVLTFLAMVCHEPFWVENCCKRLGFHCATSNQMRVVLFSYVRILYTVGDGEKGGSWLLFETNECNKLKQGLDWMHVWATVPFVTSRIFQFILWQLMFTLSSSFWVKFIIGVFMTE